MRCIACDCNLTDFEATRKSVTTGEYIDLCETCFKEVADVFIEVEEREDLKKLQHTEEEDGEV